MNEVYIRVKRDMRKEVKKKHPNLGKSPVYIPVQNFSTRILLSDVPKEKLRGFIENLFEKEGMRTSPEKYPFREKETVSMVWDGEEEKLFEGEIKIPERFQDKDTETVEIFERNLTI